MNFPASFNSLPWHDAELIDLVIDRANAGFDDIIEVQIKWPGGKISSLLFEDCYKFTATMNFGIIAPETIYLAECITSSIEIDEITAKWNNLGTKIDNLLHFHIKTSSTGSDINIYADYYEINDVVISTKQNKQR